MFEQGLLCQIFKNSQFTEQYNNKMHVETLYVKL